MSKKKKSAVVVKKNFQSISMSINGACFQAEGDAEEVSAKFKKWLDETLAPVRAVKEMAEKTFKP